MKSEKHTGQLGIQIQVTNMNPLNFLFKKKYNNNTASTK